MDKDFIAAVLGYEKPEPLSGVEPFDGSLLLAFWDVFARCHGLRIYGGVGDGGDQN